jgi:hypothetical protein
VERDRQTNARDEHVLVLSHKPIGVAFHDTVTVAEIVGIVVLGSIL